MPADIEVIDPLLDSAPFGFVRFTDPGVIRVANATLHEMLGLPAGSLAGQHVEAMLTVGARIFYQTHLFPVLRLHGKAEEIFLLLRAADGSAVGAIVNAVRRERDGEWLTDCALIRVVERRKFEEALLRAKSDAETARADAERGSEELRRSNSLLEEQAVELEMIQQQLTEQTHELEEQRNLADSANQAKSAFLASMSHELRTPLNAIGGYVQLLAMTIYGPVNSEQLNALQKVERSQRHLLRLINEVLNLSRIEAGTIQYELADVPLREVVDAVMPMVEPQMTERGILCELAVDDAPVVHADRAKVEQILLNLLGNAVKFTSGGGRISVRAYAKAGKVCVEVRDTGIGIPENLLDQVFDPFVQVDASPTRRAEGTGLGLAISRDLARGMNGELSATSEVGQGTTMTLTLPAGLS